jgi:hypothetical protein
MTAEQVNEAIEQMKSHCRHLELNDYHVVSARGVLYTLGYHSDEEVMQVLRAIADRGFDYCLDPYIIPQRSTHFMDDEDAHPAPPPSNACYWGPDQLRSRLESLR